MVGDLFGAPVQGIDCWEEENLSVVGQVLYLKVYEGSDLWAGLLDRLAALEGLVEGLVGQP